MGYPVVIEYRYKLGCFHLKESIPEALFLHAKRPGSSFRHFTHLPLDKMAAVLADVIFKCIFLNENDRILIRISLKFVPRCLVDNKPALVQVMAWRWLGDKPLPEPMMTEFIDTYMWH